MLVYTCPQCGRFADESGQLFVTVQAVLDHIEAFDDHEPVADEDAVAEAIMETAVDLTPEDLTAAASGATVQVADEEEPLVTVHGESRPLGEVLTEMDNTMSDLETTFNSAVHSHQNELEDLTEAVGAYRLAIQELQAGMDRLAEELGEDVEYQFEV